jgi:hypothetical protein
MSMTSQEMSEQSRSYSVSLNSLRCSPLAGPRPPEQGHQDAGQARSLLDNNGAVCLSTGGVGEDFILA